jgi:hypothetical protein
MDWSAAVIDAIPRCRLLVLLLSQAANVSPFVHREVERAVSAGKGILPVRLENVRPAPNLELFISTTQRFDAFPQPLATYLPGLVNAVAVLMAQRERQPLNEQAQVPFSVCELIANMRDGHPVLAAPGNAQAQRVALLYKRRAQPDERLLNLLETHLTAAGHSVFIDRHMTIGVEWAKQIEQEIRGADAVVVLLSHASVYSEMLACEVEVAYQTAYENAGKPRLLPVRIKFEDLLPPELAGKLEPLHYFLWQGPDDDTRLLKGLTEALTGPPRVAPTLRSKLERVGGAVPPRLKVLYRAPDRPGTPERHRAAGPNRADQGSAPDGQDFATNQWC